MVLQFIKANSLFAAGTKVVAAVSGGADSVCLLHILAGLRDELGVSLHVAHLDHQLRGAESQADAAYVANLAAELGLPITIGARDVKSYRAVHRLSLEEAAREARYSFLAEVVEKTGACSVAVGHTADDHVETILMHLIRGTGTRGLRGLQPSTVWRATRRRVSGSLSLRGADPGEPTVTRKGSVRIVRPLLCLSRQQTEEYCRNHDLQPCNDSSNESLAMLRNRVRRQLVPLLESYNPAVKNALMRTARLAGDDLDLLSGECARLSAGIARQDGDAVFFDKEGFLALPAVAKRHILREAMSGLSGELKDVEARHIDAMVAAADKPAGKRISLAGGLVFAVEYDRLVLAPAADTRGPLPPLAGECALNVPGETVFSGWRITAQPVGREEIKGIENGFTAYIDNDAAGENLLVRPRRPGDIFQPLGMEGQTKEVAEFMIDAKIPRAWRARVPLVCSPDHIIWIVGWRIDDRAKVGETTSPVLRLRFQRC
jgi:tRNA(Ile)-lysidine synthase